MSNINHNSHHYAIDAAKLVEKCRRLLHSILNVIESNSSTKAFHRHTYHLASLSDGEYEVCFFGCWRSNFTVSNDVNVDYSIHSTKVYR